MAKRMFDEKEIIDLIEEHGGGGGEGAVKSVNGKIGKVVLSASDIKATNSTSIQANLERIDLEVEGLVDDVADLNAGKLDANKSAVSSVGGLVIPTSAPSSEELVGINTSGSQSRVTIGSGLSLVNGELTATGGTGGVTKEYVDGEISRVEGEIPSIEGLATKSELEDEVIEINAAIAGKQDAGDYALKSEIPSVEGLATVDYVDQSVTGLVATSEMEDYVTDAIANKADKSEIPDVSDMATTTYVGNYVAEQLVNKQDKLESYSDHASVSGNTLTINYKVRQEDNTYSDVPVEFTVSGTPDNMVTTDTAQEITGVKTFTSGVYTDGLGSPTENNHRYIYTTASGRLILTDPRDTSEAGSLTIHNAGVYLGKTDLKRVASEDYVDDKIAGKQDTLTAGENITIVDNVISATGGGSSYTFTDGLTETGGTVSLGGELTQEAFMKINTKSALQVGFVKDTNCVRIGRFKTPNSSSTSVPAIELYQSTGSPRGYTALYGSVGDDNSSYILLSNGTSGTDHRNGKWCVLQAPKWSEYVNDAYFSLPTPVNTSSDAHETLATQEYIGNLFSTTSGDGAPTFLTDFLEGWSANNSWSVSRRPGWIDIDFGVQTTAALTANTNYNVCTINLADIDSTIGLATAIGNMSRAMSCMPTGAANAGNAGWPNGAQAEGSTTVPIRLRVGVAASGTSQKFYTLHIEIPVKKIA